LFVPSEALNIRLWAKREDDCGFGETKGGVEVMEKIR
jgi:hypothetical protein